MHEGSLILGISGRPHFGNEADGPTFDLRDSEPSGYHISNVVFFLKKEVSELHVSKQFTVRSTTVVSGACG